ncbi:MAG TPA: PadR family transcriptional regulator [Acidimicrobiia bacterium]|jgi:DNA-binding PadR family transcriptional regulator
MSMLELAVLGLLKEQPLHGYELKKRLGDTLGFLWGVSYGSLYPALRRLERAGAIEIVEPAPPAPAPVPTGSITGDVAAARLRSVADRLTSGTRRTRKAYRITERGDEMLVELLLADDERADPEKAFTLKLVYCRHVPPQARLELLESRRAVLVERLARAKTPARGRARGSGTPDRYLASLLEHRTRSVERDLEWVDELIAAERAAMPDPGRPASSVA